MKAVFECPIPPTLNEQIDLARDHWSKSSKVKAMWTGQIARAVMNLPVFPGAVWLDFEWIIAIKKGGRRPDPDNFAAAAKYILDGLTEAKKLPGDSIAFIQSPVIHRHRTVKGVTGDRGNVILTISDHPIYTLTPYENSTTA